MAIWRKTIDCPVAELEDQLTACYADDAFSIEEIDLPGGYVRLLAYFRDPIEGAEPVDESVDWQSVSEQPWVPFEIGQRLWLAPPWLDAEPPAGRMRLNYLRGQACGTGFHAATRLCLAAMDRYLGAGDSLLDVGAGSGILSVAADLLEAGSIIGCDIDHPSTLIAAQNSPAAFFTGSVRSVRSASFDVVAANINATMIANLRDELVRVLKPGGRLIAGGYRVGERPELPLQFLEAHEEEGWESSVWRRD